jgi:hypothetical protein
LGALGETPLTPAAKIWLSSGAVETYVGENVPIEMTDVLGTGNPAGREDCGISTDPVTGGPWLTIRMFEVGTVAKNPGVPFTGLTWTRLVGESIVWIVAWSGMLKAISGFGAGVVVVPVVVAVDDVVDVAVGETGALAEVMPETCCEPISEVNAGEPKSV